MRKLDSPELINTASIFIHFNAISACLSQALVDVVSLCCKGFFALC